jgi:hypothetical protein
MIRGTNAQFKFILPYNVSEIKSVKIVFWQNCNNGPDPTRPLPIIKVLGQCSQSDKSNELYVTLNQEETLRFVDDHKGRTQLLGTTKSGIPFATREKTFTVYPIYDDSILDGEILPTPSYDGIIYLDGQSIVS